MFKYEYGKLPDALNMFFVKNRSVHNYNTRIRIRIRMILFRKYKCKWCNKNELKYKM